MLTPDEIKKYRTQLEAERRKLSEQIRGEEKPEDFGSDIDGLDEEKNEAEELGNRLAMAQAFRVRLNEIDEALARILRQTYGVCVSCGGPIAKQVLDLVPESSLCERCKKS